MTRLEQLLDGLDSDTMREAYERMDPILALGWLEAYVAMSEEKRDMVRNFFEGGLYAKLRDAFGIDTEDEGGEYA